MTGGLARERQRVREGLMSWKGVGRIRGRKRWAGHEYERKGHRAFPSLDE